jgi:hypothetical protein
MHALHSKRSNLCKPKSANLCIKNERKTDKGDDDSCLNLAISVAYPQAAPDYQQAFDSHWSYE